MFWRNDACARHAVFDRLKQIISVQRGGTSCRYQTMTDPFGRFTEQQF